MIASMTAACVNLVLIMALGKVYEKLALKLTQWGKYWNILFKHLFSLIFYVNLILIMALGKGYEKLPVISCLNTIAILVLC